MSADNYYRICKHPKGGYAAVMGFMSNKVDGIVAEPHDDSPQYATVAEAVAVADSETILEYGIEFDADCLPLPPGQPGPTMLRTAFWEALARCVTDGSVSATLNDGTQPGLVFDREIPEALWMHMAGAFAELKDAAGADEDMARQLVQSALWMKRQYRDAGLAVARVFCNAKGIDADALEKELLVAAPVGG